MSTIFVFVFAFACLATFVFGARKQWTRARLVAAVIAVLSFLMALLTVSVK
jgi:hypothetical protein